MSKQYLTTHTIDQAHPTDIFSLAATSSQILSVSGSSTIHIHSTTDRAFPLAQSIEKAHRLGCHHIVTSSNGEAAASVGFGGEVKVWSSSNGVWGERKRIVDDKKAGEIWAIVLSEDGQYLAAGSFDGRISVWDDLADGVKIRDFETKGSFCMSIDLSADGRLTASGHENGGIYVFNNDTGRLFHSLPSHINPVRALKFSPASTLLAVAGDSKFIALYDVASGEQVANLKGHGAWVFSIDWNFTGEYLLSGAFDGKTKVWSIDRRTCVATHTEAEKALWSVKWLPKTGKNENFVTAGANRSISFYREAVSS